MKTLRMGRRGLVAAVAWALLTGGAPARAAGKLDVDPRAWEELDIVPMPKQLRFTDRDVVLNGERPVTLVVGRGKCRQSEIGAEWINKRLSELGQPPRKGHG